MLMRKYMSKLFTRMKEAAEFISSGSVGSSVKISVEMKSFTHLVLEGDLVWFFQCVPELKMQKKGNSATRPPTHKTRPPRRVKRRKRACQKPVTTPKTKLNTSLFSGGHKDWGKTKTTLTSLKTRVPPEPP